jgi:hypothetical protein
MKVACTTRRLAVLAAFLAVLAVARGAAGQAVQLPTFHFFSLSTTVSVPDGGDAMLGGIGRSSSGRAERGVLGLPSRPFDNVATAGTSAASNVSASATIHDFEATDKALLGQGQKKAATARRPSPLLATRQDSAAPLQSITAIRAQQAAEDAARQQEAGATLARARQLLAEGKTNVARIYFQSAIKKSADKSDVHEQALAALRSIEQAGANGKIAGQ